MTAAPRCSGDDGFAGGLAGLAFGLLLFVAGTLLAAFAWAVVDTKGATEEAARQAARVLSQPLTGATDAQGAEQAAEQSLEGSGRDPQRARIVISASTQRCADVTVSVEYPAPLLYLPFTGRFGQGENVSSRVSEVVEPYLSGLPGEASCG